jgi:hypothetical protein
MTVDNGANAVSLLIDQLKDPDNDLIEEADLSLCYRGEIKEVLLRDIGIDPSYQRDEKPHSKRIARKFNPHAAGVLKVGRRPDGTLWMIDGQQRRKGMMLRGIEKWPCEVIQTSGKEEEAIIYELINGSEGRKSLTSGDLFRARLAAGNQVAKWTLEAVQAAGLKLKYAGKSHGKINHTHVGSVALLYRYTRVSKGPQLVTRVLNVYKRAWPRDGAAWESRLLQGALSLFSEQGDRIDDDRMVKALSKQTPQKIEGSASALLMPRVSAYVITLAMLYNRNCRKPSDKIDESISQHAATRAEAKRRSAEGEVQGDEVQGGESEGGEGTSDD